MSESLQWIIIGLVTVIVMFAVFVGVRTFTNATTPITINEVEPGVHCALATTSDGVAIDCWKVEQ